MSPLIRIFFFSIIIALLFTGCKPKTRRTETNEDIRWAMMAKTMDDSSKNVFLESFSDFSRGSIINVLKKYENANGIVEYEDYLLSKKITLKVSLENGMIRSMRGEYDNGVRAVEFYSIKNKEMIDSAYRYYPSGGLYSRRVTPVDTMKRVYEEFYENGPLRSRNTATRLFNWHMNGKIAAIFLFDRGQVVKRTLWYWNGVKEEESGWRNDKWNGVIQEWDSLGKRTRNEHYVNGTLIK